MSSTFAKEDIIDGLWKREVLCLPRQRLTWPWRAADCLQRPLRARFRQQL